MENLLLLFNFFYSIIPLLRLSNGRTLSGTACSWKSSLSQPH